MQRLLLVEDDPDIREIMVLVLDQAGFSVTALENGHGVLKKVQQDRPAVVLLDAMLGDMDGRDICREIKNDPATQAIPVMIISASHGFFDPGDHHCKADAYLAKPFDVDELVNRVKALAA